MVKRLRRCPLKAKSWVRFPLEVPYNHPSFDTKLGWFFLHVWNDRTSEYSNRSINPRYRKSWFPAFTRYCQVLCANSFTSLAELCLHRAGEPALDCPIAEGRERVKGGEAACEALDASSGFCYQPASSSCTSRCFMLMYFFRPIGFRQHDAVWHRPA